MKDGAASIVREVWSQAATEALERHEEFILTGSPGQGCPGNFCCMLRASKNRLRGQARPRNSALQPQDSPLSRRAVPKGSGFYEAVLAHRATDRSGRAITAI